MSSKCEVENCLNHNRYNPEWQNGKFESGLDKKIAYISG
jgi:hypothetical protein